MVPQLSSQAIQKLKNDFDHFLDRLPNLQHGSYIYEALLTLLRMTEEDNIARLDWKILKSALQDMERAFQVFHSYRHVRKIAVFGSARLPEDSDEYQMAVEFARCITAQGFMVRLAQGAALWRQLIRGLALSNRLGLIFSFPLSKVLIPLLKGTQS
jgi:hypothetical protein